MKVYFKFQCMNFCFLIINMTHDTENAVLARQQHVRYFKYHLQILPARLSNFDSTRISIAFFALSGLDLLGAIDEIEEERKRTICDWLYQLQVLPDENSGDLRKCGFQGSSTLNCCSKNCSCDNDYNADYAKYVCGHLAMTYTALACLIILGDDLSRLNRQAIAEGVKALQQSDGSFCATLSGSESDMRFVYCATCICYMIQDWSGMDKDKTVDFILNSMSYDFGFGQSPGLESHGGSTYCAVASLFLMNRLHDTFENKQLEGLKRWSLMRQVCGYQGRPNKPVDTCYSFWVGATLKLLDVFHLSEPTENRSYILSTQDSIVGGFAKWVDSIPDPLHTYLGLSGLSLLGEEGLLEVDPRLNISKRALKHLEQIHQSWMVKQ
ncbi:geranylgeranyl transferase type-1 subunit beta [Lycorma delicatula]|uniref:geranylgeranyl transferase type-1 subunit beta n=1 Tax=Lycorma delicatula TaxID=130591 RepID=UPI003F517A6C